MDPHLKGYRVKIMMCFNPNCKQNVQRKKGLFYCCQQNRQTEDDSSKDKGVKAMQKATSSSK